MATVYLRLRNKEFWWKTTPRKLLAMIDVWRDITDEIGIAYAITSRGKTRKGEVKRQDNKRKAGMATFSAM